MSSNELLVESTNDPRIFRWMLLKSSGVWKDQLTSEQYVNRDNVLTPCKLYNFYDKEDPVGIYYYILRDLSIAKPLNDADELELLTYNIVCSCELLLRESWKFTEGIKKNVLSGVIGSVFTLNEHRSKGFANYLITALDKECSRLLGHDGFISLYSEVGAYYERFNYSSYPVNVLEFKFFEPVTGTQIKNLKFNQFDNLIEIYLNKFEQYLAEKKDGQQVAIIPKPEMIEWHHIRSNYISKTLYDKLPDNFGFQIDQSFVIFSHDYGENFLSILMIYATDIDTLQLLLNRVAQEAKETGFENVHIWESQLNDYKLQELDTDEKSLVEKVITVKLDGKLGLENDSLSALKMIDGSIAKWEGNHKWPWF